MRLFKILLCDPDIERLKDFEELIAGYMDETGSDYTFFKFGSGSDLTDYLSRSGDSADIVILSCELDGCDGIAYAGNLKKSSRKSAVVLYGCRADRIEDIFEARVSYFLFLPADGARFERCMNTVIAELDASNASFIKLKSRRGIALIEQSSISYISSDKRQLTVNTSDESYSFYMKLDEIAEMLGERFVRCHQSYLVNMDRITSLTSTDILLSDGERIPVSEKKYNSTKTAYLNYIQRII